MECRAVGGGSGQVRPADVRCSNAEPMGAQDEGRGRGVGRDVERVQEGERTGIRPRVPAQSANW